MTRQEFLIQIYRHPPPDVPEKRYLILAKQRRREWRCRDLAIRQRTDNVTRGCFIGAELTTELELIDTLVADQKRLVEEGISTWRLAGA
jgi:hypothetical protein